MNKQQAEQEVATLMLHGYIAKEGLTDMVAEVTKELDALEARFKAEHGDRGQASFIAALTLMVSNLSSRV